MFRIETIIDLDSKYGFNLRSLMDDFILFVKNDKEKIESFFKGDLDVRPQSSFDILNTLFSKTANAINSLNNIRNQLLNYDYWEIFEKIEQIKESLYTMKNGDKWARSSKIQGRYTKNQSVNFTLKENQTIENLVRTELGSNNFQNDWFVVAINNRLREEDYDNLGGTLIVAQIQRSRIDSVVSVIDQSTIYGNDIHKKFEFVDSDILYLSNSDTFKQTCEILLSLNKNDNPFFPDSGTNKTLISGTNINSLQLPSFFRQLYQTFSQEDSVSYIQIIDFKQEQDGLFVKIKIVSVLGDEEERDVNL